MGDKEEKVLAAQEETVNDAGEIQDTVRAGLSCTVARMKHVLICLICATGRGAGETQSRAGRHGGRRGSDESKTDAGKLGDCVHSTHEID